MINRITIFIVALLSFQIQVAAQNTSAAYSEKVRKNATIFHRNFTTGDFDKNGPLVNEKIYVNSNNAIVIGRDKFVDRIKRFNIPFPNLALRDRVIIVDENEIALLYIMQGTQTGPYGKIPPSGNKINVYAAEFFTMDDHALMKELLTITQLDQLKRQITGTDHLNKYEKVTLLPIKKKDAEYKELIKNKLESYVQNFNIRDWDSLKNMFADNTDIKINGNSFTSSSALIDELKDLIAKVPDVTYHLIRNVAEGDRGAIAYEVDGTILNSGNGTSKASSIQSVKQGIHFQFDEKGRIVNMVVVYNSEDFNNQLK